MRELEVLAQQLSQIPRFSQLARDLDKLAVHLTQQGRPTPEKLSSIQELRREVEDRLAEEKQGGRGESDRLNQVANALRELEEGVEKQAEQGGGGLKTSQLEEREVKGKEWGKGDGVGGEGELDALGRTSNQHIDLGAKDSPSLCGSGTGPRDGPSSTSSGTPICLPRQRSPVG